MLIILSAELDDGTTKTINGAELAILAVSASIGEFEEGMSKNGRTREHIQLASIQGVKQLIVAVNKMDDTDVGWGQARYDEVVKECSTVLTKAGFNPENIAFIPISGWNGDNMLEKSDRLHWYKGRPLVEAIDSIELHE